jgi:two-component system response regulator AtoC
MKPFTIFIVEDDPWFAEILEYHLLLNPDNVVERFEKGQELLRNLHRKPDLITLDIRLPDYSGSKLFDLIRQQNADASVVVISGQENIGLAVELFRKGAADYIVKDENAKDQLWNIISRLRETNELKSEVLELRNELGRKYAFDKTIKGQSPLLKSVFELMEKATKTNINVSITGETGTGKEVVAKAIHYNGPRKSKPFVAVNMAAIPSELVESELFGHERGAFTGALSRKLGKFQEAQGGTIFLDEVAELSLSLQSKLLRVLQERELTPVGSNELIKLDIRVIVATHKNLIDEVRQGKFREDLYYRLIGLPIELPPLRERGNDVVILAKYFMETFCKENDLPTIQISPEAKEKLISYNYPGNVRELKSIVELGAVLSNGEELCLSDITFTSAKGDEPYNAVEKTLREYTVEIIKHFLKKYDNDVMFVANRLDIGKSTIYKMIKDGELVVD